MQEENDSNIKALICVVKNVLDTGEKFFVININRNFKD